VASESREILEKFNSGAEDEALFKLLEIPGDLLPVLAAAFRTEHILRLSCSQRQDPKALHFMAEALNQTTKKFGRRRSTAL
jgi:hypothetical protein